MPDADTLSVEVVYALPERAWRFAVQLPSASTVADAIAAFERDGDCPHRHVDGDGVAIFGKLCDSSTRLHDGDRVELLRPLLVDPKQQRRERARTGRG